MLQDRHTVDVNVMLFLCWSAGFQGGVTTGAAIEQTRLATAPLQEMTIRPLRARRRAIPRGEQEAERQMLLDQELAAEKAELALLEALAHRRGAALADWDAIERAAAANLRLYFEQAAQPPEAAAAVALAHLARAAATIHLSGGRRR
jgi:uncharacterized protein (TIGR02444 family)